MPRADNRSDNGVIELKFGEMITRAISNSRPDLNLLLRMKDEASARQLMVEADCLRAAGVISEVEWRTVLVRALSILNSARKEKAA